MADKEYLDAEGLQRLKDYIDAQIQPLRAAINLLNGNDQTPGSIQSMIDDAINEVKRLKTFLFLQMVKLFQQIPLKTD